MINNKSEILKRWNQYFQELLEGKEENDEADNPVESRTKDIRTVKKKYTYLRWRNWKRQSINLRIIKNLD
jgi:hypothetical protein